MLDHPQLLSLLASSNINLLARYSLRNQPHLLIRHILIHQPPVVPEPVTDYVQLKNNARELPARAPPSVPFEQQTLEIIVNPVNTASLAPVSPIVEISHTSQTRTA
jgi:hypothetical protein